MQKTRPVSRLGRASVIGIHILIVAVFGSATVWAQVRPVATTASADITPAATTTPAGDIETAPEASSVRLVAGRSTLIDVGAPIARVSLTSADVADALVTSPNQLLVHGKVPGSISMFVWSRTGSVKRYEVAVQRDTDRLSDQMKILFPNEPVQVHSNGRNVVLSGTVGSKDTADKAVAVASGFVGGKDDVVSLLQVSQPRGGNQVLLRVRFAEVSRNALTEFGMSLFTSPTGIKNTVGRVTTQQYSAPNFSDLAWTKASGDFGADVTSAEGKFSFSDFLNLFLLSEKYDLGTVIRAMQSRGLFESLAEPNLVAESGKEASFLAGGEFPIPVVQGSSANAAVSVVFKEFGIRLNFTPTVTNGRVHLKVRPEVSTLDYGNAVVLNGFRIPALTTRRTETSLELRDGQTFAIAGLLNNQMASTLRKVPGIGDIPIIGHLFRSRAAQKDQTELVVMITPEILQDNSDGVTDRLPRLPEPFLAPLPQDRTIPAPPPAFRPGSANPRGAAEVEPAAPQAGVQPAAAAAPERVLTKEEREDAEAEERARAKEQERQDKLAREQARQDLRAAERDRQEATRRAAITQKEQEKAAREQAKRDAAAAKRQAVEDKRAEEEAKRQAEREEERQRAIASAEAKLRALEAEYQAQISKDATK